MTLEQLLERDDVILVKVKDALGHIYVIGTRYNGMELDITQRSRKAIVGGKFSPPMIKNLEASIDVGRANFDVVAIANDLEQCLKNAEEWFKDPKNETIGSL